MKSDRNDERARVYYEMLNGNRSHSEWIKLIVQVLGFLLARYINED